jgi:hypothetical protein
LRAAARKDLGVAAACILTAFGGPESDDETEQAEREVGALIIAHIADDLRYIRTAYPAKG